MSSRASTPVDINTRVLENSPAPLNATIISVFGRIMHQQSTLQKSIKRDMCKCPEIIYNYNYNPLVSPNTTQPRGYSPYIFKEPMHNNCSIVVANLPQGYTLAPAPKRARTSWVQPLGYTLINSSKTVSKQQTYQCCKHCTIINSAVETPNANFLQAITIFTSL